MKYTQQEIIQFVHEEDVKFIRLVFCDIYGRQKNVSIMPSELQRAFEYGVAFDASAIYGFSPVNHSDLFLHPDLDTISIMPWRPNDGKVVRMFCNITYFDGTPFENDTRNILMNAIKTAKEKGFTFFFGTEIEFYLFKLDEEGERTDVPYDKASYMDVAPLDKGENVRREICLTLERMGITPESSHHEEGPGQNEIDFRYTEALKAADNALTFITVVKAIATKHGLYADFSPKPIKDQPGNGLHINLSCKDEKGNSIVEPIVEGILENISDITLFLNCDENSYARLGINKAPKYISWSKENRSQLIRIPAAYDEYQRIELRSPDPLTNPYLAFALLIYSALEGIEKELKVRECIDLDLSLKDMPDLKKLPSSLKEAKQNCLNSNFVKKYLPENLIKQL